MVKNELFDEMIDKYKIDLEVVDEYELLKFGITPHGDDYQTIASHKSEIVEYIKEILKESDKLPE